MKILQFSVTGLYLIIALVGLALATGWWFYSATLWGKWAAVFGIALSLLPLAVSLWMTRRVPFWLTVSLILAGLLAAIPTAAFVTTPAGQPRLGSPVSQRFTPPASFPRYSIPNIVSETEQMNLGFLVMPALDPLFTYRQAQRDRVFTMKLYQEMETDPDFHQLGSSLGGSYADLFHMPFDVGHYYLYIPKNRPSGRMPVLVFLHGSLGNFKAYTWVLSKFAEQNGFIVLAPSYGFGSWNRTGGVEAIQRALQDLKSIANYDDTRIYLMGMSNGGLGISYLADAFPEKFQGLIYVSPVMPGFINQPKFQSAWRGRPVLILTGEADERIPVGYVTEEANRLVQAGIDVKLVTYPGEDHFMFFSKWVELINELALWFNRK